MPEVELTPTELESIKQARELYGEEEAAALQESLVRTRGRTAPSAGPVQRREWPAQQDLSEERRRYIEQRESEHLERSGLGPTSSEREVAKARAEAKARAAREADEIMGPRSRGYKAKPAVFVSTTRPAEAEHPIFEAMKRQPLESEEMTKARLEAREREADLKSQYEESVRRMAAEQKITEAEARKSMVRQLLARTKENAAQDWLEITGDPIKAGEAADVVQGLFLLLVSPWR